MLPPPDTLRSAAQLRRQANARVRELRRQRLFQSGVPQSTGDSRRLFHELQVHQIELELQNTELRQARDQLEAALENYTDLYDFAPAGYFTLTPGGRIEFVNLTGASLVGIERSRLMGQSFAQLFAAADRATCHVFLKRVFAGHAKQSGDFELQLPGRPPLNVSIEARRFPNRPECRAVMMDITERKRAEAAVQISEIRYRRLFETAHDGVLLLDPGTCKITDANPFMTKLLGYPNDQLVGKELFEIGLLQDETASREMFQKLKRNHEIRYENLPLESQAGRHQEVEVVANLYQENGRAVIQCNIRDITERKRAENAQHRMEALGGANLKLRREIIRRQAVEESLKQSQHQQSVLLEQSRQTQEQLRYLSRQVLQAQEDERKRISRELHDVIAQTLTTINVRLAALKKDASVSTRGIGRSIARTQSMVEKSVNTVHEFARELRPAVLDDLGLIPALHSFVKQFSKRTRIHVHLKAFAEIEQMDNSRRTVLFRVAQEALTNVARHARAGRVEVHIQKLPQTACLEIKDDGKSFKVERTLNARGNKRLGLLGMRERVEMVGGTFDVESAPGRGTTVRVELPFAPRPKAALKKTIPPKPKRP